MFIRQNFHSQRLIDQSLSSIIYSQTYIYIYIYSYPTTIQIEVEASGFGAKKEERRRKVSVENARPEAGTSCTCH